MPDQAGSVCTRTCCLCRFHFVYRQRKSIKLDYWCSSRTEPRSSLGVRNRRARIGVNEFRIVNGFIIGFCDVGFVELV